MTDDERAQSLIDRGLAVSAKDWLMENLDSRRLGEMPTTQGKSPLVRLAVGSSIINQWVTDIRTDDNGHEYASTVIYELPKRGRKPIFMGLNLRLGLAGMQPLTDTGQKYIISPFPTAEQFERATRRLRE